MLDHKAQQPAFIISAHVEGRPAIFPNDAAHKAMENALVEADVAFKPIMRCYKGKEEKSFVIHTSQAKALGLAALFGQESILFLDRMRQAILIYVDLPKGQADHPRTEHIGELVAGTEEEAKVNDSWTFDRLHNQYFYVVPPVSALGHKDPDWKPEADSSDRSERLPASDPIHKYFPITRA